MRKHLVFAVWISAAAWLGQVSLALADQNQTPGQQTPPRQTQETGKQASGQKAQVTRPPAIPAGFRLLSLKEGRAIAQGITWADDEEGLAPDCSHLVHTLYQQAGYPYPYASSLDLYRGTSQFLRVRHAHPGDLVVWRGHVGIVINPREHSFFSTTRSGVRVQNYRSAYWRARGYPHFFRYLTKVSLKASSSTAEAANPGPPH
ncbi:MAG TPA: NlpC/P60 family protein [Candidatus Dormibacteraeota bacterium]|nr:NlpC/P60 family protein [Candidatus Dormibacteraeota bacterium]